MNETIEQLNETLRGRYEFERPIGSGGMATVYLAHDVRHDRQVAIKVLRPELSSGLGADRFLREIKIAARLHHPHILAVFDSGRADDLLYYVMPYVKGESLRQTIAREGKLPVRETVRILREVVDALAFAHAHDVVHRDIKPDNILITGDHVAVADFGVAKAVSAAGSSSLTGTGIPIGTPTYMAPEQAAGDPAVDQRSDIYAVGVLAYELLIGRPPFAEGTTQEILAAHLTKRPTSLRHHRSDIPEPLESIVMRCLEKNPSDRWQSAAELRGLFDAIATPSGELSSITLAGLRRPARWAYGVMAALVALIIAAVFVLHPEVLAVFLPDKGSALVPQRVLVAQFENATGDAALDGLGWVAADWLSRGLQETGVVEVIDSRTVLFTRGEEGEVAPIELAQDLSAGTMVSGSYLLQGDSILFEARVLEVSTGRLLTTVSPVAGLRGAPLEAIEILRQRVMAGVASLFDPSVSAVVSGSRPPSSYEAYQEYMHAVELHDRDEHAQALQSFLHVIQLDSLWTAAAVYTAVVYMNLHQPDIADSIARALSSKPLAPMERYTVEWLQGFLNGDYERALEGARQWRAIAPGQESIFTNALAALSTNRPREALEVLMGFNPRLWRWGDDMAHVQAAAHHLLGDHRKELEVAADAFDRFGRQFNNYVDQIVALGALGRTPEIQALLNSDFDFAERGLYPSFDLQIGAIVLRAYGYEMPAQNLADAAVELVQHSAVSDSTSFGYRSRLADALAIAERWEEAHAIYSELRSQMSRSFDPADHIHHWMVFGTPHDSRVHATGMFGVTAARLGDRAAAVAARDSLERIDLPFSYAVTTIWRAKIAAVLGDNEEALRLLRKALREGAQYGVWLYVDPSLDSLRTYPPFREMLQPRG